MAISEKKMKIVIANYFKAECNVNTSIREAFEKGFRIGVEKALSTRSEPQWIPCSERLPEKGKEVLVHLFGDSPYIAWVNGDHWFTEDFAVEPEDVPIAWMELPEPYREVKYA